MPSALPGTSGEQCRGVCFPCVLEELLGDSLKPLFKLQHSSKAVRISEGTLKIISFLLFPDGYSRLGSWTEG